MILELFLGLASAFGYPGPSRTPSRTELSEIAELIRQGRALNDDIATAEVEFIRAESTKDSARIAAAKQEQARIAGEQSLWFTRAIHKTITAYGLELDPPNGVIRQPGPFRGDDNFWIPIAGRNEARALYTKRGTPHHATQGPLTWTAMTYGNGLTVLFPESFRTGPEGPAHLAMVLRHEQKHWKLKLERGYFRQKTTKAEELELTLDDKKHLKEFGLPYYHLDAKEADLRADVEREGENERWERLKGFFRRGRQAPPSGFELPELSEDELGDIRAKAVRLRAQIEEETAVALAQARAQEDLERRNEVIRLREHGMSCYVPDDPGACRPAGSPMERAEPAGHATRPLPAQPARPRSGIEAARPSARLLLPGLARQACQNPASISQERLDSRYGDLPTGEPLSETLADGLSGCERNVLLELIRWNAAAREELDAEWLRQRARASQQSVFSPTPSAPPLPNDCIYSGDGRCLR